MPTNICKFCNKTFETFSRPSKACSIKCRQKLLDKKTGYYTKYRQSKRVGKGQDFIFNCQICSKSFETRNPNQKNCSKECQKESRLLASKKQTKDKIRKKCLTCGNQVKTVSKYCSEDCKPKKEPKLCKVCNVTIKRNNSYCPTHKPVYKPVRHNKKCVTCGKDFISKRKTTKYCKRKCSPSEKARRRIAKRKNTDCTPNWVNWDKLSEIEIAKPNKNYELDHIIPLNHPEVCGLHVPWNLQWLTRSDNQKKSNSFDGTRENISWKKK